MTHQIIRDALESAEKAIRMAQNFPSTGDLYRRSYMEAREKIAVALESLEKPQPPKRS
jgi:hypothetical protein